MIDFPPRTFQNGDEDIYGYGDGKNLEIPRYRYG